MVTVVSVNEQELKINTLIANGDAGVAIVVTRERNSNSNGRRSAYCRRRRAAVLKLHIEEQKRSLSLGAAVEVKRSSLVVLSARASIGLECV